MVPKGLKIGDTFTEQSFSKQILYTVIGFDERGNYISKAAENGPIVKEDLIVEELPFASTDDDVDKEQPVVEEPKEVKEVKKATPKKKTASKKKTATKKK